MLRRIVLAAALMLGLIAFTASASHAGTTVNLTLARSTPGTMINGKTQTFTGTAPSNLNYGTVKLWRMVGKNGTPVAVGSAVIHGGTFTVTGTAAGAGDEYWQAVVQNSHGKFVSRWLITTSYTYTYVGDLPAVATNQWDGRSHSTIGGTTYNHSVIGYSQNNLAYADYNLGYHCVAIDAWIGVQDSSATGATLEFSIARDGAITTVATKAIGKASHTSLGVRGVMRIRLMMQGNHSVEAYGAYGNARVLCDRAMA